MNTTHRTHILLAFLLLFIGCKKDVALEDEDSPGPTPYVVPIPPWLTPLVGDPVPHVNNPTTVEGVQLGRRLFYEPALSNDFTQSCSSCHVQSHGFSDPRPFSIGTNGAAGGRNAMAVINLGWDHRMFWDGRAAGLEAQAYGPVANMIEMCNTWPVVVSRLQADPDYVDRFEAAFGTRTIDSILVVKAIAQFERSFTSFNSRFDRFEYLGDSSALNAQEFHGHELFMRDAKCNVCHHAPLLFDHALRNNGLDMNPVDGGLGVLTGVASDWGRFKVPTLRNIAATAPYMHDSRFSTLEEVVHFYAHDVQVNNPNIDVHMGAWILGEVNLTEQDEADLVAFLRTFTDSTFLTNPAYGPPQ